MIAEAPRVSDEQLNAIARRLSANMNDDGLRAWYAHDVQALVLEVLALRREQQSTRVLLTSNPPLTDETLPDDASLTSIAERLVALWSEQEKGIWARARNVQIREQLREVQKREIDAVQEVARLTARVQVLELELEALNSKLLEAGTAAGKERSAREHFVAEANRERDAAIAERDAKHVDAARAIEAVRTAYEHKAAAVRALLATAADELQALG